MREIYRQNPAYHEFRLNDRNDLVDLLKHGESYIISLSNKSLGIVGTVRFDAFKDEKLANRHILTFKRKNDDGTRVLLDGKFEFADCFIEQEVGSVVVFITFSDRREYSVLIS